MSNLHFEQRGSDVRMRSWHGRGPAARCQQVAFDAIEVEIRPRGPKLTETELLLNEIEGLAICIEQRKVQPIQMRIFRRPMAHLAIALLHLPLRARGSVLNSEDQHKLS